MITKKSERNSTAESDSPPPSPPKFFTLILEELTENGTPEATKVPAKQGKCLYDAIQPVLENYNMSCETHSLYLGASKTPLLVYNNDAHDYRDTTIYVRTTEKTTIIPFAKQKSDSKKSQAIAVKRFSELLDDFDVLSPEKVDGEFKISHEEEFYLEGSWKDVVMETEEMSNHQKLQQEGVWELLTSEVGYIKDIKVIIDVFKKTFKMIQYAGYLTEVEDRLLFANIEEVYDVNLKFWCKLKQVVEKARQTKEPIAPSHLSMSFDDFELLFKPYIQFCNADTSNLKLPDYPVTTNELLKKYLDWCNNHKLCKRLTISAFLIKPLQRVTKYSLLLKAIMNKSEDLREREIAEEIMSRVETFVSTINSTVHLRQEGEKMDGVVARISDYYPIEMFTEESENIIKEYCKFDLRGKMPGLGANEIRFLLKDGHMKLVEKQGKKDVYIFLFSDCLVVTKLKKNSDKYRIIRQPYRLNKTVFHCLKEHEQIFVVYLDEFGLAVSVCILQTDPGQHDKWKSSFQLAKESYQSIRGEATLFEEDDVFTDDAPSSKIPIEEILRPEFLRRMSSVEGGPLPMIESTRSLTESTATSEPSTLATDMLVSPSCDYEWDNVLLCLSVVAFIIFNIFIYRIYKFFV